MLSLLGLQPPANPNTSVQGLSRIKAGYNLDGWLGLYWHSGLAVRWPACIAGAPCLTLRLAVSGALSMATPRPENELELSEPLVATSSSVSEMASAAAPRLVE